MKKFEIMKSYNFLITTQRNIPIYAPPRRLESFSGKEVHHHGSEPSNTLRRCDCTDLLGRESPKLAGAAENVRNTKRSHLTYEE